MAYTLFTLDDCSLCERAARLVAQAGIAAQPVDIGEDAALDARYGSRIPVLHRDSDGRELDWPFDAAQLQQFVAPP